MRLYPEAAEGYGKRRRAVRSGVAEWRPRSILRLLLQWRVHGHRLRSSWYGRTRRTGGESHEAGATSNGSCTVHPIGNRDVASCRTGGRQLPDLLVDIGLCNGCGIGVGKRSYFNGINRADLREVADGRRAFGDLSRAGSTLRPVPVIFGTTTGAMRIQVFRLIGEPARTGVPGHSDRSLHRDMDSNGSARRRKLGSNRSQRIRAGDRRRDPDREPIMARSHS